MPLDPRLVSDLFDLCMHTSTRRLAQFLGVNQRSVQRWMREEDQLPIPDDKRKQIADQAKIARDGRFFERLEDVVQDMHEKGVDEEVIIAHLAALHNRYRSVE